LEITGHFGLKLNAFDLGLNIDFKFKLKWLEDELQVKK